ncbi:hypothetical protein [Desulfothermobacter acidiphilus]|uniref:hypothetical protein n=1 Tax=Desulfothermobacter acidiphilus TaxID=1938353 RepID=UPI003F8AA437
MGFWRRRSQALLLVALVAFIIALGAVVEQGNGARAGSGYPVARLLSPPSGLQVGLVTSSPVRNPLVLAAYEAVLQEEGVLYQILPRPKLAQVPAADLARQYGALILLEGENQDLTPAEVQLLRQYVSHEKGQLLVVSDAGQCQLLGSELLGVKVGAKWEEGYCSFGSPSRARIWGFPPGKYDHQGTITGYGYGKLKYRHFKAEAVSASVLAWSGSTPIITEKRYPGGGTALYVNLPLAWLKQRTDDLPLRSILTTFLFAYARLPHLVNAPEGRGTLVVNIHVCSSVWAPSLAQLFQEGILDERIPFSVHITAGPDCRKPGDGLGFDALRPDRAELVRGIARRASLGAHGGWAHDYFAYQVVNTPSDQAKEYIQRNLTCLQELAGRPVREYSAPGGNHPPWVTRWLAEHGVVAFYSPGNGGSAPQRPWLEGQPFKGDIWEFPVTPCGRWACLEELSRQGVAQEEVIKWIDELATFCSRRRVVRTVYTHAAAYPYAHQVLQHLHAQLLEFQRQGKLQVATMEQVADFLNRRACTTWRASLDGGQRYQVELANPRGLRGIALAIYLGPDRALRRVPSGWCAEYQGGWCYLTCQKDATQINLLADFATP